MPRSGSTAFAEKMAVDNDLINNKEFFNRNVRGFNPYLGTYVIKGDLYSIGNFTKVDCENLKPNLPCNMNDRIEILKNEYASDTEIIQKTIINGELINRPYFYNLFDTMYDPVNKSYLGEDFAFCKRWTDIGGKCHAYINDEITHVGEHSYVGCFGDELIRTT